MRSREEWQEGNGAVLSPSPVWGAPGREHRLGAFTGERTRSPVLVGPAPARQERPSELLDGLGTASATASLQTLPTELSPAQGCPSCSHLLSLCPPHCHPPHSTALCHSP